MEYFPMKGAPELNLSMVSKGLQVGMTMGFWRVKSNQDAAEKTENPGALYKEHGEETVSVPSCPA